MKLLLIALAVGLAVAARDPDWPRQFQASRDVNLPTFRYEANIQVMTGMPKSSNIWSGSKAKCIVKIQMISSTQARMQVETIKYMKRVNNRILGGLSPKEMLPDDVFTTYKGPGGEFPASRETIQSLKKPVAFTYENGEIRDLKFLSDETVTSKNWKKGVIQTLQLNFNRRHENSIDEQYRRAHPGSLYYTVMEDGLSGKCENIYSIQSLPHCSGFKGRGSEHCNNVLNVTKVRNFNKCLKRPIFNMTEFNPVNCLNCSNIAEENLIKSYSTQKMNVTLPRLPNRHSKWDRLNKFLITEMVGQHDYIFEPFGPNKGQVCTHMRMGMKLIERKAWKRASRVDKSEEIKIGSNVVTENLIMSNPVLDNLYLKKGLNVESDVPTKKRIINEVLDKILISKLVPEVETEEGEATPMREVSDHVLTLSRLLHECTEDELVAIFEQFLSKPKNDKKRLIMLDILPTIRTRPIAESNTFVDRLLKAVIEGEMSESRSQLILTSLSFSLLPTTESVELLKTVCEKKSLDFSIRRTACLAMGQKMYENCNTLKSRWVNKSTRTCTPTFREQCYKTLKSLLWEATKMSEPTKKEEEMLIALKTIGNSGMRRVMPLLMTIIENRLEHSEQVRSQALFALRRMLVSKFWGRDVQITRMVLPICLNQLEAPEVRIAAYNMLMACRPELYELEVLARTINKDQSRQVASYVYSHLVSLSNSSFPCCQDMKRKVNRVLNLIEKPIRFGPIYSKGMHLGYMNKDLMMGGLLDSKLVYSPESPIPRAGSLKLTSHVLGNTMSLFEVGFHAEGLSKIWEKTFGPTGNWYGKSENSPNSEDTTADRNPDSKIRGHVYYKLFGTELNFNTFDEKTFTNMIRNQLLSNFVAKKLAVDSETIETERVSVSPKNVIVIPTEVGLPLTLNISHVTIAKVKGLSKVVFPDNKLGKVNVELDMIPSMHTLVRGSMSVQLASGIIASGVKIDGRLRVKVPLRLTASLDMKAKKVLDVSMDLPTQERKLIEVDIVPKTFITELKPKSSEVIESERIIYGKRICTPYKEESVFDTNKLDLKFKVKTHTVSRKCMKSAPYHPLVGKQSLTITSLPSQKSKMSLTVEYESKKTTLEDSSDDIFSSVISKPSSSSSRASTWKSLLDEIVDFKPEEELTSQEQFWITKYGKKVKRSSAPASSSSSSSTSRRKMDWERSHEDPSSVESYEREQNYEGDDITSAESYRKYEGHQLESQNNWDVKKYFNWWKQPASSNRRVFTKKASEHNILLKLKCDSREVIKAQLKYLSNPISSKMFLIAEHEPLMASESSPNKIEVVYEIRKPITSVDLLKRIPEEEQKIRTFLRIVWGQSLTNSPSTIRLRSTIEKSPKQMHDKDEEIFKMPEYEMCLRDRTEERPYTPACLKVAEKESELRQLTAVIESENTPRWVKKSGKSMIRMIQYYLYNHLEEIDDLPLTSSSSSGSSSSTSEEDVIQKTLIKLRLTRELDMMHLIMKTPMEKSSFLYVPLPMKVIPPSYRRPYMTHLLDVTTSENWPAACEVTGNVIKTFDNVVIKSDELLRSDCDLLVARDCSPNNFFSVHLTKTEPTKREVKIRMTPTSSEERIVKAKTMSSGDVKVEVDGKVVDVEDGEIEEMDLSSSSSSLSSPSEMPKLLKIKRISSSKVVIKSPRLGLVVKYSGRDVRVLLSQEYKSKQCGICGDFDGEATEEMKTPSMHLANTPEDFIKSYANINNKCTKEPDYKKLRFSYNPYDINRRTNRNDLSELKRRECSEPRPRHIVREVFSSETDQLTTCVSVEKIKLCEPQCAHPIQTTREEVEFVCVDPSNPRPMEKILDKVYRRENPKITSSVSSIKETMPVGEDQKCFF